MINICFTIKFNYRLKWWLFPIKWRPIYSSKLCCVQLVLDIMFWYIRSLISILKTHSLGGLVRQKKLQYRTYRLKIPAKSASADMPLGLKPTNMGFQKRKNLNSFENADTVGYRSLMKSLLDKLLYKVNKNDKNMATLQTWNAIHSHINNSLRLKLAIINLIKHSLFKILTV